MREQEKNEYRQAIQQNQHEIYVISFEEMDKIVASLPPPKRDKVKGTWESIRGTAGVGTNYYSSSTDAVKLARLVGDLGGVSGQAYIKYYGANGGKPHIVLKGRPGLRKILTGTKYGVLHPKVVSLGLGRHAAVGAAKAGGVVSLVLISGYRIVDYALTDEATLSRLIGTLATDVVKVGLVVAASVGAAVATSTAVIAVGPILAVVIVGFGLTVALEQVDQRYGLTEKVVAGLEEMGDDANAYLQKYKERALNQVAQMMNSVIDYAVDATQRNAIILLKDSVDRFVPSRPRL
jgi:hypothetical protein